jgi:hypothetical protein
VTAGFEPFLGFFDEAADEYMSRQSIDFALNCAGIYNVNGDDESIEFDS